MTLIRTILTETWGLFVDDGAWAAPLLFLGFLAILLVNVLLAARKRGLVKPSN
jgi:hypothetical protein